MFAALTNDFQRYLREDPQDPAGLWTVSASNPPAIMGEAVHLMPSSESASTLRAQVPELGSGSMTIELGPQLSRTLLILSLGGAQFHRLEGSRGVYLFDAQNTMVIDPEGSRRDHLDGSSPLRVTLSTELAGDQLRVSYSIAGSDGESPVTFESIELTAGSMQLAISARWSSAAPDNNATIVLQNLRCP